MKLTSSVYVLVFTLFVLIFTSCAIPGSYVTSRTPRSVQTYRYDEGGKKVLVYEIDNYNTLFVYDENDKQAKMMMTGRKWLPGAAR